jgi:hypothetical protein
MSEFDRSVDAVIEGVVSRVSWRNPHILLEVTATDDGGAEAVWTLEGSAVDDGHRLQYLLTVTEPDTLVEPFVWDAYFTWKRGEEVNRYECTLEEWASTESTLSK